MSANEPSWSRVRELFETVVELDASAARALLDELCGDDLVLRRQVDELLARDRDTRARPEMLAQPNVLFDPERVGPYRLVREIGTGGMGKVYLAYREGPGFEQRVALKLVKVGMDTSALLARFARERAVLASLEHDGIARLLDAGATHTGRPYLVMEYVEGASIDGALDERRASVRERLELFLGVCDAVLHAHRRLVVHRDLKPSNILVTAEGRPKLLDFGIAKVLGDDAPEVTLAGERVLTPAYASPEQLRGEPVGVASDVYSLSVILHELLVGARPSRGKTAFDFESALRLPSALVTRSGDAPRSRRTDANGLRRALAGDLDTILHKGLEPEVARRYASVEQLAGEIRLHLAGRPITARPATLAYRTRKFVQRNRAAVAAASLALAALLSSGVFAWTSYTSVVRANDVAERERTVAEKRAEELRSLALDLVYDVSSELENVPGVSAAKERILRLGADVLAREAEERSTSAERLHQTGEAYLRIGALALHHDLVDKRVREAAVQMFCRAEELGRAAWSCEPGNATAARVIGHALFRQAREALFARRTADAEVLFDEALAWIVRVPDVSTQRDVAHFVSESATFRGQVAIHRGDLDAAARWLHLAGECAAEYFALTLDPAVLTFAAYNQHFEAQMLAGRGEIERALAQEEEAASTLRAVLDLDPLDAPDTSWLCEVLVNVASLAHARGDIEHALACAREADERLRTLVEREPDQLSYIETLAIAQLNAGECLYALGHSREGEAEFERSVPTFARLFAADPDNRRVRGNYVMACTGLAHAKIARFELGAAREAMERALALVGAIDRSALGMQGLAARFNWVVDLVQVAQSPSTPEDHQQTARAEAERVAADIRRAIDTLGGFDGVWPQLRPGIEQVLAIVDGWRSEPR